MYMNLKPNQHKRISFNRTTMTSLGFLTPPALKFSSSQIYFFAQVPFFTEQLVAATDYSGLYNFISNSNSTSPDKENYLDFLPV